jgi:hypothetical protein
MNTNTATCQGYRFPADIINDAVWLHDLEQREIRSGDRSNGNSDFGAAQTIRAILVEGTRRTFEKRLLFFVCAG